MVVPIMKNGNGKSIEDYRGVTLMLTLYKIYASVLADKIRWEIESKKIIPENQTGFWKGMGMLDNIYVISYQVNRNLEKKGEKLVVLFMELKAACDIVNRGVLVATIRERWIKKGLVRSIEEVMRETKSKARVGVENRGLFLDRKEIGTLNSLLFNLLVADLEEVMSRVKWGGGGVRVGESRLYSLAYADDIVVLAGDEEQIRNMMESWRYI